MLTSVRMLTSRSVFSVSKCSYRNFSTTIPINIFKEGTDPELQDVSSYPECFHNLHASGKTLTELLRMDEDMRSMEEEQRLLKLYNRHRIREKNAMKKK